MSTDNGKENHTQFTVLISMFASCAISGSGFAANAGSSNQTTQVPQTIATTLQPVTINGTGYTTSVNGTLSIQLYNEAGGHYETVATFAPGTWVSCINTRYATEETVVSMQPGGAQKLVA
jgi:hypothetical protein